MNKNEIGVVRLESISIKNLKNIEFGEIYFPEKKKVQRGDIDEDDFKNVLGIYGQNGSGKTGCIDALRLIQAMLSGVPPIPVYSQYVMAGEKSLEVDAEFLIKIDEKYYYVVYEVEIETISGRLRINNERLSFKEGETSGKSNLFFKYNYSAGVSLSFLKLFTDESKDIYKYISRYESDGLYQNR